MVPAPIRETARARETYALNPELEHAAGWALWGEAPRATLVAERDGAILKSALP